ncbi:MAG: hypothetical protein F4091_08800 [Acidimicrobiales bacterium]|nr:hypothetical protein [Acidimicrobiales bacterium]MYD84350.1 hypothetical protein [Acidimicrobiales bacterium]MYJ65549.1 hypothetical protein [Acidimicrobiales bacterium]
MRPFAACIVSLSLIVGCGSSDADIDARVEARIAELLEEQQGPDAASSLDGIDMDACLAALERHNLIVEQGSSAAEATVSALGEYDLDTAERHFKASLRAYEDSLPIRREIERGCPDSELTGLRASWNDIDAAAETMRSVCREGGFDWDC